MYARKVTEPKRGRVARADFTATDGWRELPWVRYETGAWPSPPYL
jgi:hypothetical protein